MASAARQICWAVHNSGMAIPFQLPQPTRQNALMLRARESRDSLVYEAVASDTRLTLSRMSKSTMHPHGVASSPTAVSKRNSRRLQNIRHATPFRIFFQPARRITCRTASQSLAHATRDRTCGTDGYDHRLRRSRVPRRRDKAGRASYGMAVNLSGDRRSMKFGP